MKPQTQASNSQRNGKDVVVKRPNLGEGDKVPKAAPRVAPKTNTAESTQVKRQPMREIEAYQKNSDETGSTEDSRIGQRDVVKGYSTRPTGGKSKIPGLR